MRILSVGVILLALGQSVSAQQPNMEHSSPVPAIQTAIIKLNQLVTVRHSTNMASLIEAEIVPLFDFNHIANKVLSVVNTPLNQATSELFINQLKHDIMTTLLAKLLQSHSSGLQFISAKPLSTGVVVVTLKIDGYAGFGVYFNLLLHQNKQNKWQIFDIVLNNNSLVNYYQKQLLIKIRRHGTYKLIQALSQS